MIRRGPGRAAPRSRRRVRALITGLLAVLAVLAAVVLATGETAAPIDPAPAPIVPVQTIVGAGEAAPVPTPEGVAAALAPALENPALGDLTGEVTDTVTGEVLWSRDADRPLTPASVAKTLTAAAAIAVLAPDHRWHTDVVLGADGRLVLIGGGDPTLTDRPTGTDGFFTGAGHLDALAAQIREADVPLTGVDVDVGRYRGPTMAEGWFDDDIPAGNIAPIEPVMLDSGRLDPSDPDSPRTPTPALDTGRALAAHLGLDTEDVGLAAAPAGAEPVARVSSAPMTTLVREMMTASDNVLAEAIGREVALAAGHPADFAGAVDAVAQTLADLGVDTAGATMFDASGLSVDDLLPARMIDRVLTLAATDPAMSALFDTLPIAAGTGTMAVRLTDGPGAGWVRAKTGTLSGVSSLAGVVVDVDGRALTFTLMSTGTSPADARPALDALALALRGCGCR